MSLPLRLEVSFSLLGRNVCPDIEGLTSRVVWFGLLVDALAEELGEGIEGVMNYERLLRRAA